MYTDKTTYIEIQATAGTWLISIEPLTYTWEISIEYCKGTSHIVDACMEYHKPISWTLRQVVHFVRDGLKFHEIN